MRYLIVTTLPARKGVLGPIPERNVIDHAEAPDLKTLKEGLHIPVNGECLVIEEKNVVVVKRSN